MPPASLSLKLTGGATYNDAKRCLRIVASALEPDADGEVVDPRTIRLDSYRKNPVVIWSHDQKQYPIAKCEDEHGNFTCWVDEEQGVPRLIQEWYFADTPAAKEIESLYQQKILRGASIGFIPDGYRTIAAEKAASAWGVKKQLRLVTGGELRETSAVPVPCCPGALALGWVDVPALMQRSPSALVTKSLRTFVGQAKATDTISSTARVARVDAKDVKVIPESVTAEEVAAIDQAALVQKAMDTASDASGGSTDKGHDSKEMFHGLASGYLRRMFDSDDEEEHKSCMKCIKAAHSDHLKYKALEEGDRSDREEDDADGTKPKEDNAVEVEEKNIAELVEKELGELVTKGVAAAAAPLETRIAAMQAEIDQLRAELADRPTAEEVAAALVGA